MNDKLERADADLLHRFSEAPERRRLTEATRRTGDLALSNLAASLAPRPLTEAAHEDFERWLAGLPPRSHVAAVRAFYRWALGDGVARVDPTAPLRPPIPKVTDPDALHQAALLYVSIGARMAAEAAIPKVTDPEIARRAAAMIVASERRRAAAAKTKPAKQARRPTAPRRPRPSAP